MAKNIIIGQSGGPTAVINSSLAGVYKEENEKSEPFSYRKKVRILLLWCTSRDSNPGPTD